ncbi:TPA: hypothetical protein ACFOVJ_000747 [Neisseria meningitidis]|uniref:hypothetical protein n=1 Tax=Neisseria meningitidis TaxID=487 RepID=UPI00038B0489|nr:hypothetical protein [Neisseria meningitidis]EQD08493.1 putative membrane protein [Neisseria meningitidis NM151]EQD15121.1 putative membrane protein [Neisseria meningitidis NM0552]AKM92074.1 hypothetical protein M0579_00558 [Neisseria meningitidis M0579]ANW86847.1 putative membrane protein [Neisseria meningitidis]EQD01322.1 putative membrane protein [Neisseria meningitidis 96037]
MKTQEDEVTKQKIFNHMINNKSFLNFQFWTFAALSAGSFAFLISAANIDSKDRDLTLEIAIVGYSVSLILNSILCFLIRGIEDDELSVKMLNEFNLDKRTFWIPILATWSFALSTLFLLFTISLVGAITALIMAVLAIISFIKFTKKS